MSRKKKKEETVIVENSEEEKPEVPKNEGDENPDEDSEDKPDVKVEPKIKPEVKLYTGPPRQPLKIFCHLSGKKPDQMAGFRRYASNQKLGPMTMKEWQKSFVEFQNKPMK